MKGNKKMKKTLDEILVVYQKKKEKKKSYIINIQNLIKLKKILLNYIFRNQ